MYVSNVRHTSKITTLTFSLDRHSRPIETPPTSWALQVQCCRRVIWGSSAYPTEAQIFVYEVVNNLILNPVWIVHPHGMVVALVSIRGRLFAGGDLFVHLVREHDEAQPCRIPAGTASPPALLLFAFASFATLFACGVPCGACFQSGSRPGYTPRVLVQEQLYSL